MQESVSGPRRCQVCCGKYTPIFISKRSIYSMLEPNTRARKSNPNATCCLTSTDAVAIPIPEPLVYLITPIPEVMRAPTMSSLPDSCVAAQ